MPPVSQDSKDLPEIRKPSPLSNILASLMIPSLLYAVWSTSLIVPHVLDYLSQSQWPTITAHVSKFKSDCLLKGATEPSDFTGVALSYAVDGKTFQHTFSPRKGTYFLSQDECLAQYPIGKNVIVHYNPNDPQEASVESAESLELAWSSIQPILPSIALLALAAAAGSYRTLELIALILTVPLACLLKQLADKCLLSGSTSSSDWDTFSGPPDPYAHVPIVFALIVGIYLEHRRRSRLHKK